MKPEPIVTVAQELTDRTAQREKLGQFFAECPHTIWTQETLAEKCGADIGAVRTRISELRRDDWWRDRLVRHTGSYEKDGATHRGKMRWEFVPRPDVPLGPDASTPRAEKHPPTVQRLPI